MGQGLYPDGVDIPRSMTPWEQRIWPFYRDQLKFPTANEPPTGPVRCASEYEPMDGVLMAWEGTSGQNDILKQMAKEITTVGNAKVYMVVDSASERTSVNSTLTNAGVNMANVEYCTVTTDTIWIRDYGPRYIFQGGCRSIVDHIYNRPRPNDDAFPGFFQTYKSHPKYDIPLIHGGGNMHLNGIGESFVTRLINNENPGKSEQVIHDLWRDFQNIDTTFFTPFNTSIDSTQHIDMWMQVIADRKVIISDWPLASGSAHDQICDGAASLFASRGWTVYRVPAVTSGGVHYTFTNVTICNNLVLIPVYSNSTADSYETQALQVYQGAMPGYTIKQINCQALVTSAGVMHCVMMHVPANSGGTNPVAYVLNLNQRQNLQPGQQIEVRWIADDDVKVTGVDIRLSLNGGETFPIILAGNTAHDGSQVVTIPAIVGKRLRIQVVARDANGNTGTDMNDADLTMLQKVGG